MSAPYDHPDLDVLDRFAAGELDEGTRRTTEQHLSTCSDCRAQLTELARDLELVAVLRKLPESEPLSPTTLPEAPTGYRFVRELGRGGMGIVYEAEQARPIRRVAIKVLGSGPNAGENVERMLQREAQALARLEHPSVARIYDVGRLPDGRPFLTMELVDGSTLTRYVDEHALPRRGRLELFAQLCDAVAFAHQRGVIHRDLKPSNVLVDRTGRPRVLDFGLARLVDVEGEASVSRSVDSGRIRGTLAFMSPEQSRGDEQAIDARSDIYSLGVILYVLLVDDLPYAVTSLSLPEAVRVICEEPPIRPSRVDRSLRGDLETILVHALEKDPRDRYATVAALKDDVERFLDRQPILARSPSLAYQLGKLVQRHTLVCVSVAGAFVAAIVVGIWTSALYRTADAEREKADRTAAERLAEATRAETMVQLLQKLLGSADVHEARGPDYTVRALLDEFAGNFGTSLKDQPDVEARLRATIGRAYLSLGLPSESMKQVEHALELEHAAAVPDRSRIADLMEQRGWCLHEEGRFAETERVFRELLADRISISGPNDAGVARAQYCVGDALRHQSDAGGAEEMARAALATWRALGREDDPDRVATLTLLGQLLADRGELQEAKSVLADAVESSVRVNGERSRVSAVLTSTLGTVLASLGEQDAASERYVRALGTLRELIRGDHPEVARLLNNLGELRRQQGNAAEAVQLLRESHEMRQRVLPAMHPDQAQSLNNLALALYATGDADQAIECMRKAVEIRRAALDGKDPVLPTALNNLASLERTRGAFDVAIALCREALALQEARLPPRHPDLASTLLALGRTYTEKGDLSEAEPLLRRAAEIRLEVFGEQSTQTAESRLHLGVLLRAAQDPSGAEAYLRSAVAGFAAVLGGEHHSTAQARGELGGCLLELHRIEDAEHELLDAQRVLEARLGARHSKTRRVAIMLAALYDELGRTDEAARWRAAGMQ